LLLVEPKASVTPLPHGPAIRRGNGIRLTTS
jgi:hypothetical protein